MEVKCEMHFFTSAEKGERYNSSYVFHFTEVYTNKYFGTFSILCSVINLMAQFWWRWAYILETYYSPRERFTFFLSFHSMSLGIQGWVGDWVSVVSKCIMGLFRRTLSPLSLAITKLHGKMGMNASPAIVPQCRKFRPHWDPPPQIKDAKMARFVHREAISLISGECFISCFGLFHFIVSKIVVCLKRKLQLANDSYYTMYICCFAGLLTKNLPWWESPGIATLWIPSAL